MTNNHQNLTFDNITLFYRRFLQLIAILPFEDQDYTSLATRLLGVFFLVSSITNCTCFVSYIIIEGMPSIDTVCEIVATLGFNGRYFLLLWRRKEFCNLLDDCQKVWHKLCEDEASRRTVHHFERKVRRLFYCMLGSFFSATFLYGSTAINLTLKSARSNGTHTKHLPFKWFAEGGENFWPGYKINFLLQEIVSLNAGIVANTVDSAAPLLIMIGAGYFRALRLRLYRAYESALHDNESVHADRELIACVQHHQRVLNYCAKIEKVTSGLFFVTLLTTVYNLSLVGIKLAGRDPDRYKFVTVVLFYLCQLFICQWAPDHLINESTAISTTVYSVSVPWIKRRIGKVVVLMITRAQRPVQMTAAGFVHLSLEHFGEMLKGAISFFMVLRSLIA